MKTILISAVLAAYNEQENIKDCLVSTKQFAHEIIVVDGSSEDKTREIAESVGARVIKTTNKKMFHINKNLAISNARGKWTFLMDADERVTEELANEILKTVKDNPKENGFWVNRRNWFLGGYLKKGGAYPDSVIRLFRKDKGKLPEKSLHEQVVIDGKVGYLKNNLLHLADPNFERYLKRFDRYTEETSMQLKMLNPGRGFLPVIKYMLIQPVYTFAKIYIRHKGYQDGFRGFIWALFSGFHHYFAYTKYWNTSNKK